MAMSLPTPADILNFYEGPDSASDSDTDDAPPSPPPPPEPIPPVEQCSLSQKTITICGSGSSLGQLFMENEYGVKHGDELWATDNVARLLRFDRLFYMEHPSVYKKQAERVAWLESADLLGITYVSEKDPLIPDAVLFPIQDVVNELGLLYISSSAAYALALAICWRASKIRLFGLDFDSEPVKRGCIEFLICKAVHMGINIEIPSTSLLLGNNLSLQQRLFGFEHSADPFVLGTKDGKRCLMRSSELPDKYTVAT